MKTIIAESDAQARELHNGSIRLKLDWMPRYPQREDGLGYD